MQHFLLKVSSLALTYCDNDNDDNNLETLKGKKRIKVGFELAIFGFGGRRITVAPFFCVV